MQNFNYHTHTKRCGHATGEDEEYIQAAIQSGFTVLGISEHLGYQDWDDDHERIAYENMNAYFRDMEILKQKYKDQIQLRVGVEFEYFDDCLPYLKKIKEQCDYMINGQHAIVRDNSYLHNSCSDEEVATMAEQMCEAMQQGLTDYIAHPDYFMLGRDHFSKACEQAVYKIGLCAKSHHIPIEINLKGMKRGKRMIDGVMQTTYPFDKVWDILTEIGCSAVFGYDAHHPDQLRNRSIEDEGRLFVKRHHIQMIDDLKL